jgi:ubiquinone/menaquinone biosynthesis C-methylase UbiE
VANGTASAQPDRQKHRVAGVFARAAPAYDQVGPRFFARFGSRLVELAQVRQGETVLDVACGRGASLFPAADGVGAAGRAVGIDLADGMIDELTRDIRARGLLNVETRVMDAEDLRFPAETFDCVLCGFCLFFFPQRERALSEMRRVLKSGGRLAISTWGKTDVRWRWLDDLLDSYRSKGSLDAAKPALPFAGSSPSIWMPTIDGAATNGGAARRNVNPAATGLSRPSRGHIPPRSNRRRACPSACEDAGSAATAARASRGEIMKITAPKRLALLAGLLLLALIVFATGIQAAQAAPAGTQGRGGFDAAHFTAPQPQGRGGFDAARFTAPQPQGLTAAHRYAHGGRFQPPANVLAAQSGSSGASTRTAWIAAGAAAAALIVVIAAWALSRRRRQPGGRPSPAYCAQHPEDALCTTA